MYTTGQKPGKGVYECTICGQIYTFHNDSDVLPECPHCGIATYRCVVKF